MLLVTSCGKKVVRDGSVLACESIHSGEVCEQIILIPCVLIPCQVIPLWWSSDLWRVKIF